MPTFPGKLCIRSWKKTLFRLFQSYKGFSLPCNDSNMFSFLVIVLLSYYLSAYVFFFSLSLSLSLSFSLFLFLFLFLSQSYVRLSMHSVLDFHCLSILLSNVSLNDYYFSFIVSLYCLHKFHSHSLNVINYLNELSSSPFACNCAKPHKRV